MLRGDSTKGTTASCQGALIFHRNSAIFDTIDAYIVAVETDKTFNPGAVTENMFKLRFDFRMHHACCQQLHFQYR